MNTIKTIFALFLSILFLVSCSEDDSPSDGLELPVTYQKTIELGEYCLGVDVQRLNNGDFILAVNSLSADEPIHFWNTVIKTDSNGDTIWTRDFDDETSRFCSQIIETEGGFILAGTTINNTPFFLTKIDTSGDEIWSYSYGSNVVIPLYLGTLRPPSTFFRSSDGNLVIAGVYYTESDESNGILIVKTDTDGNLINQTIMNINASSYSFSICDSDDGGYILVYDSILHKINEQGETIWRSSIDRTYGWTMGIDVIRTSDGGYVVMGDPGNHNDPRLFLFKCNENGEELWFETYDFCAKGYDIKETSDSGLIITGEMDMANLFLIKTDSNGTFQWRLQYGRDMRTWGNSVTEIDDGLVTIGTNVTYNEGNSGIIANIFLLKTDSNGIVYLPL